MEKGAGSFEMFGHDHQESSRAKQELYPSKSLKIKSEKVFAKRQI